MNDLKIFENDQFGKVRVVSKNNEPWFVAKDVCDILDIKNTTQAIQRLDDDEVTMFNIGGLVGESNIVNEYGLYSLILGSRKESAKQFKRWITHEVLPNIRKNGGYIANQENMSPEQIVANALVVAQNIIDNQKKELEMMKPKSEYFDNLVDRNLLTNFRDTAKELKVSQSKFIDWLLSNNYVYRDRKGQLQPYSQFTPKYFELKEWGNSKKAGIQTLITPAGREAFRLLLGKVS